MAAQATAKTFGLLPSELQPSSVCLSCVSCLVRVVQIKVKTLTGKEIEIDIESDDTIARIKERVEEKEGIPPPQQRLIFGARHAAEPLKSATLRRRCPEPSCMDRPLGLAVAGQLTPQAKRSFMSGILTLSRVAIRCACVRARQAASK